MALKPEILRRKLLEIAQAIARLRTWTPTSVQEMKTDAKLQWALERGLQVAAEALFDAGNHILSGHFQEAAQNYRDVVPRLVACGVLVPETGQRLQGLAGFRNILVHDYADVDLDKVYAVLGRLDDVEAFSVDVLRWLDSL